MLVQTLNCFHVDICTRVLQPCEARMIRSAKCGTGKQYMPCASSKYFFLSTLESLQLPDYKDISTWVSGSWDAFSSESIRSTFEHIEFTSNSLFSPINSYPATHFAHNTDYDIKSIGGEDFVEITEQKMFSLNTKIGIASLYNGVLLY